MKREFLSSTNMTPVSRHELQAEDLAPFIDKERLSLLTLFQYSAIEEDYGVGPNEENKHIKNFANGFLSHLGKALVALICDQRNLPHTLFKVSGMISEDDYEKMGLVLKSADSKISTEDYLAINEELKPFLEKLSTFKKFDIEILHSDGPSFFLLKFDPHDLKEAMLIMASRSKKGNSVTFVNHINSAYHLEDRLDQYLSPHGVKLTIN